MCENKFNCGHIKYETRYFNVLALYAKILKFGAFVYFATITKIRTLFYKCQILPNPLFLTPLFSTDTY